MSICFGRGRLSRVLCLLVAGVFSLPALAQTFPSKSLRLIVPYGPLGAVDFVPRLLAERMSADLGQPVVVENRGGGLGLPAIGEFLNAPADGHTIFAGDASHWSIVPAMQTVPYNFLRDFAPISITFSGPQVWAVLGTSPIKTMQDLVAQIKANPGKMGFSSPGVGSLHHLEGEIFAFQLGLKVQHVPYKGGGEMVESLLRGDTQFLFISPNGVLPYVKTGKMTMLAVSTNTRFRTLPNTPTIAEATGLKDFNIAGQQGLFLRAGTPKPIVDRVAGSLLKAMAIPEIQSRVIETGGVELMPLTPEQFTELIRGDIRKFSEAVKLAGVKVQ